MEEKIDDIDRILLRALQADGTLSLESLAGRADISTNTCWRRVKRLEESGLIARRVALLDADKLGLGQTIFVAIRTNDHSAGWLQARSVHDYDRVYKDLIARVNISDVSATFAMECMKNTTELPV